MARPGPAPLEGSSFQYRCVEPRQYNRLYEKPVEHPSPATVRMLATETSQECILRYISGAVLCLGPKGNSCFSLAPGELLEVEVADGVYLGVAQGLDPTGVLVSVEHFLPRPGQVGGFGRHGN